MFPHASLTSSCYSLCTQIATADLRSGTPRDTRQQPQKQTATSASPSVILGKEKNNIDEYYKDYSNDYRSI